MAVPGADQQRDLLEELGENVPGKPVIGEAVDEKVDYTSELQSRITLLPFRILSLDLYCKVQNSKICKILMWCLRRNSKRNDAATSLQH
jgi:hypothetical protein